MKSAFIYIRVSTDEQADKGYSQRAQDDILTRYCDINKINIVQKFYEDHSAKTFERPEFNKLLLQLHKHKGKVDLLLFTKWDRFSRNAPDAYQMIARLNKLTIECQAIEQPLNLDIPENKMMLAFYLAAPEVENDRRSLNTIAGMRQAQYEGCWIGYPPVGYKKVLGPQNKKLLAPADNAHIVQWIFEQIATGRYSAESIWKMAKEHGLTIGKNAFWNAIRNPVYIGKILVKAYKDEPETLVTGKHEALISEALFYQAQDVLNGRRKVQATAINAHEKFPLRGLIKCSKHNRLLTASSSKGKKQYYDYYHCTSTCGVRFRTEKAHDAMIAELRKWKPHPAYIEVFKDMVQFYMEIENETITEQIDSIRNEITRLTERQKKALELMLSDSIDADDYRSIKKECEIGIIKAEARLSEIAQVKDISPVLEKAAYNLQHIDELYIAASPDVKKEIVCSIFPEKLEFDGEHYRTLSVNEAVQLIFNVSEAFSENEKGQNGNLSILPHQGCTVGHFSNNFLRDLKKLAALAA